MKTYEFTVLMQGQGETPEEAWLDAKQKYLESPHDPLDNAEEIHFVPLFLS
jgi:hypothetical protein